MQGPSTSPTKSGCGFWSGEKLLVNQNVVRDFDRKQIDVNAYNLRMGSIYFKTADEQGVPKGKVKLAKGECFLLPAGQFAFLLTKEWIEIPHDTMAFISMRTGIKFQGLINVSGFHVDPGYKGHLIFAVYNASPSPIQICEGENVSKIWFCNLDQESQDPYIFSGKPNEDIDGSLVRGMSKQVLSLQSLSEAIYKMQAEIDRRLSEHKPALDGLTTVWNGIIFGVVLLVVGSVLAAGWPVLRAGGDWAIERVFPQLNFEVEEAEPQPTSVQ